jgi:hypothetical protein
MSIEARPAQGDETIIASERACIDADVLHHLVRVAPQQCGLAQNCQIN